MGTGAERKTPAAPGNLQGAMQGNPRTGFPQRQVGTKQARPDRAGTDSSGVEVPALTRQPACQLGKLN